MKVTTIHSKPIDVKYSIEIEGIIQEGDFLPNNMAFDLLFKWNQNDIRARSISFIILKVDDDQFTAVSRHLEDWEYSIDNLVPLINHPDSHHYGPIGQFAFDPIDKESKRISQGSLHNYAKIINHKMCSFNSVVVVENCEHHDGVICEVENCKYYIGK